MACELNWYFIEVSPHVHLRCYSAKWHHGVCSLHIQTKQPVTPVKNMKWTQPLYLKKLSKTAVPHCISLMWAGDVCHGLVDLRWCVSWTCWSLVSVPWLVAAAMAKASSVDYWSSTLSSTAVLGKYFKQIKLHSNISQYCWSSFITTF